MSDTEAHQEGESVVAEGFKKRLRSLASILKLRRSAPEDNGDEAPRTASGGGGTPTAPGMAYVNQDFPMGRQTWLVYDSMLFFQVTPKDVQLARNGDQSAKDYITKSVEAMGKAFEKNNWPMEYYNFFAETMMGLQRGAINPKAESAGFKRFWKHYPDKRNNSRFDFENGQFLNEKSNYARPTWTITYHELFKACDYMGKLLNEETNNKILVRAWDAAASMQQATAWSGLGIGSAAQWALDRSAAIPKGDLHGTVGSSELGNVTNKLSKDVNYYAWIGDAYSRINLHIRQAVAAGQDFELGRGFENVFTWNVSKSTKLIFSRGMLEGYAAGYVASAVFLAPVVIVAAPVVSPWLSGTMALAMVGWAARYASNVGELVHDSIEAWDFRTERASPTKIMRVLGGGGAGLLVSNIINISHHSLSKLIEGAEHARSIIPDFTIGNFSIWTIPALAGLTIAAGYATNHPAVPRQSGGGVEPAADGTIPADQKMIPAYRLMTRPRALAIVGLAAGQILFTNLGSAVHNWFTSTSDGGAPITQTTPAPGPAPVPVPPRAAPAPAAPTNDDVDPFAPRNRDPRPAAPAPATPGRGGQLIDPSGGSRMGMIDAAKQQVVKRIEIQLGYGRVAVAEYLPPVRSGDRGTAGGGSSRRPRAALAKV